MNNQFQFNLIVSKVSWLPLSALHIRFALGSLLWVVVFAIPYAIPAVRDVMLNYQCELIAVWGLAVVITVICTTSEGQCIDRIDSLLASYQPLNLMALRKLQHRVRTKGGYNLDDLTDWMQAEMIAIKNFNKQQNPVSSSFLDRKI